ncbi:MAG: chondroitinase-B domain-containing protein, partial [Bacteroidota bacterium]
MRHGNETLVENNYFFGNNRPNTGGIRIINEKQTVVGNYGEGLTGHRFRGALVIMNGVPNSPPNRYMPVIESAATQNVFVNCDHVQLCAGADEERSSPPTTTTVSGNVFLHPNKGNIFTVYDDISGISFAENILGPGMQGLGETGFRNENLELEEVDGVQIPLGTDAGELIRAGLSNRARAENTGVHWYPNIDGEIHFDTGKRIEVLPGLNSLLEAVEQASAGDVLVLTEAADYVMSKSIDLHVPITVIAAEGLVDKPCLKFQKTSLFNIENGGALSLSGVRVSGEECRDKPRNTVIRTSRYSMNKNYKLFIEHCEFDNLDINHSFNVLTVYRNTFADSVVLRNSVFRDISGMVLPLNQETDDIGIYNAEQVVIENCSFENIGGAVLDLHRGGRDESTFGPMLELSHSSFRNVGHDRRNRAEA